MSSAPEAPTPRRGLGRGLEVLVGGGEAADTELLQLPLDAIHPNPKQPRRRFEPEATAGLAASLRHQGVLQPVVVRPRAYGGYELIAGERRWRAAREAGLDDDPGRRPERRRPRHAAARRSSRTSPARTSRRSRRRAPTPSLIDEFELSLGDVAERVGRSKPSVSNRVRLLELPEDVLWMLARGELTEGHARAVLALPDDDARRRLARGDRARRPDGARGREGGRRTAAPAAAHASRRSTRHSPIARACAAEQLTGLPARRQRGKLELALRRRDTASPSSSRRSSALARARC